MKKCYSKDIKYVVPEHKCQECGAIISAGEEICTVSLKWGSSFFTCRKCYDQYEINWSLHDDEFPDEENDLWTIE
jgi:hypothetical protein